MRDRLARPTCLAASYAPRGGCRTGWTLDFKSSSYPAGATPSRKQESLSEPGQNPQRSKAAGELTAEERGCDACTLVHSCERLVDM
eukprot:scaffold1504_cov417-Prasinococcus_capsulatus_cf.AAC.69